MIEQVQMHGKEAIMEHNFTFTTPTAADIAYILKRNQDNERFLRELLVQAQAFEKLLCSSTK